MNIISSVLYSENCGKTLNYFINSKHFNFESGKSFYSQKTYDLISGGGVSKEAVFELIKTISPLLQKYKDDGRIEFGDSFKNIVTLLGDSPILNESHLDELEKSVRFVIRNSYDYKNSKPRPQQYLRFRGWTGSDNGRIAASFLGNQSVSLKHFEAIIDEYVTVLLQEHTDFGSTAYKVRSKLEFSNERSFKQSIDYGIRHLSESKRGAFTQGCISHLDKIGASIAQTNAEFILSSSIFSSFIEELHISSIVQNVRTIDIKNNIHNDEITYAANYMSDIYKHGIATDAYNKIRGIDKKLLNSTQCLSLLNGMLDGVVNCYKAKKMANIEFVDSFCGEYVSEQKLSDILTSLFIDIAVLMKSKSFDGVCFNRVLSTDSMGMICELDANESVSNTLSEIPYWKYDDIISHFDYLIKTSSLPNVIQFAKDLSEFELSSLYGRLLNEDIENVLFKNLATSTVIYRLYANHYAPALISDIKVDESKLAPIVSSMLFYRTLGLDDIELFAKMDLNKLIREPSYDIEGQLQMSPEAHEAIIGHILDSKLKDAQPALIQTATSKTHI